MSCICLIFKVFYFEKNCDNLIVIDVAKEDMYTDLNYKYGRVPEHYNNSTYSEIAKVIKKEIYCEEE